MKSDFIEYIVHDVMRDISGVTYRKMFSGHGLYKDGIFFAIITGDVVYFKVTDNNRLEYLKHGCKPFTYTRKDGKKISLSYYTVPESVLEDSDLLLNWINRACDRS